MTSENLSPDMATQILRYHPTETQRALSTSAGPYKVCLLLSQGVAAITWSAGTIGDYDWIGLYKMTGSDDKDYVTYQWAKYGPSYVTGINIQAGFQARYLIWDKDSSQYKVVARTDGFPNMQVCSS